MSRMNVKGVQLLTCFLRRHRVGGIKLSRLHVLDLIASLDLYDCVRHLLGSLISSLLFCPKEYKGVAVSRIGCRSVFHFRAVELKGVVLDVIRLALDE